MSKSTKSQSAHASSVHFHTAYTKTASARAALTQNELLTVNLDIPLAVSRVLGAVSRLAPFRDAIVSALPELDKTQIDKLGTFAEALAYANTSYLGASAPPETLPALGARAMKIRDQLLTDAAALAKRGLLDGSRLRNLKGGTGYLNAASDLSVLAIVLRERWMDISSKSAIQPSELEEADQLYQQMTNAYAARMQRSTAVARTTDDRQRAYTLLVNAYDQARRAMTYLRWTQNDVDKIVPSLWKGRGGRRAGANATQTTDGAGEKSVTAETNADGAEAHPLVNTVPVGFPGSSPFTN